MSNVDKTNAKRVIWFTYNGGTYPGSIHIIAIETETTGLIEGQDFTRGGAYRTFKLSRMGPIHDFPVATLNLKAVPRKIDPIEWVKAFADDGIIAFIDNDMLYRL